MIMENKHPIGEILDTSLDNLRKLVDANTVIGTPITPTEGTTIIPISKVAFGFASGGTELPSGKSAMPFGGGSGGGVTITPLAFIVITGGKVDILQVATADNTADRIVNMIPGLFDKVSGLVSDTVAKRKAPHSPIIPE